MSILGAATLDFIQYLKDASTGWSFEPLVIVGDDLHQFNPFVTIKERPNNHTSPIQFYFDNPQTGPSSLIRAKQKGYVRFIELRIAPGPAAKLCVRYWRGNGWKQTEKSFHWLNIHREAPVQQSGERVFQVCPIERVTKRNNKASHVIRRDVIDLAAVESSENVAKRAIQILNKSLEKCHGGNRISPWRNLAVVLDGKNFMYDGYRFQYEIVLG
jgi:hypothetical protein